LTGFDRRRLHHPSRFTTSAADRSVRLPRACACNNPTAPQAQRYVASWIEASRDGGSFLAYDGMKKFTFDVLCNQVGQTDCWLHLG
jgi:hypothetical protein